MGPAYGSVESAKKLAILKEIYNKTTTTFFDQNFPENLGGQNNDSGERGATAGVLQIPIEEDRFSFPPGQPPKRQHCCESQ